MFAHDAFKLNSEGDLLLISFFSLSDLYRSVSLGCHCGMRSVVLPVRESLKLFFPFPIAPHHLARASKRGIPTKSTQTAWGPGCCLQLQGCLRISGTHLHSLQAGNIAHSSTTCGDSFHNPELQPGTSDASELAHTSEPHAAEFAEAREGLQI